MKQYWSRKKDLWNRVSEWTNTIADVADVFCDAPKGAIVPAFNEAPRSDLVAHAWNQYGNYIAKVSAGLDVYRIAMLHAAYVLKPKWMEIAMQSRMDGLVRWTEPAYQASRKAAMVLHFETQVKCLDSEADALEQQRQNLLNVAALAARASTPDQCAALQKLAAGLLA